MSPYKRIPSRLVKPTLLDQSDGRVDLCCWACLWLVELGLSFLLGWTWYDNWIRAKAYSIFFRQEQNLLSICIQIENMRGPPPITKKEKRTRELKQHWVYDFPFGSSFVWCGCDPSLSDVITFVSCVDMVSWLHPRISAYHHYPLIQPFCHLHH